MSGGVDDRRRVSVRDRAELPWLVYRTSLDLDELGDVAADVRPVGVEAACLPDRVERSPGARVRTRAGDPLPVPDVVGDIAVDKPVVEVLGSGSPVDAQCADEE